MLRKDLTGQRAKMKKLEEDAENFHRLANVFKQKYLKIKAQKKDLL